MNIQIKLVDTDAKMPSKAHPSDIGFDLTAIKVYKKIDEKTTLFDTGIKVIPPKGYYVEILPRSSISKTGYILSNSVGVIDPHYTGNLLIALTKVNPDVDDIKLPFSRCQMILRKAEYCLLEVIYDLEETDRGDGGFGSSDVLKKSKIYY